MDKLFLLSLLICCMSVTSSGQYENIWVFGDKAGIDFNINPPAAMQTAMHTTEAAAMVCDTSGKLLFYTNGTTVWNKHHDTMKNGHDLTGLGTIVTRNPTSSSAQGTVITPVPGKANLYYVFSLTSVELGWTPPAYNGRLYYSLLDIGANNGMGEVINKGVFIDSLFVEAMTTVSSCGQIWLLLIDSFDVLRSYRIDEQGINPIPVTSPVKETNPDNANLFWGRMVVSPDQKKLAIIRGSGLTLYQFNPHTGSISDPVIITDQYHHPLATAACFSEDNSKLYAIGRRLNVEAPRNTGSLLQYSISNHDSLQIIQSKILIDTQTYYLNMKLAPNGKIYLPKGQRQFYWVLDTILDVINTPDNTGVACQLEYDKIHLRPGTSYGISGELPNVVSVFKSTTFIHSRMDTVFCFTPQGTIGTPNAYDCSWNNGLSGSQITVSDPGMYWRRYFDENCVLHTDTFHVKFSNPQFNIQESNNCNGGLNGKAWIERNLSDSTIYTCTWKDINHNILSITDSLINIPSGDYILEITTGSGCIKEFKFTIEEETLKVSFTADTLTCTGKEVYFNNTSDPHFTNFNWQFGDNNTSVAKNPAHTYKQPGIYSIMLTGSGTICNDTAYGTIVVDAAFTGLRYDADPTEICAGETVYFTPYINDSTLMDLQWQMGDEYSFAATGSIITHAFERDGIYPVTLTGKFRACPDTMFTDTIKVFPIPIVNLGNDSFICLKGKPLVLKNIVGHSGILHYLWNTGAITESINVKSSGIYTLTIINENGCSNTGTIEVRKDCYTDIPNAFTPNGDGVNDYFFPRQFLSKGVSHFHMQVFNRWGEKVFETVSTAGRGWDGKFNGREQPAGMYIYVIEIGFNEGKREKYEGNILLIR